MPHKDYTARACVRWKDAIAECESASRQLQWLYEQELPDEPTDMLIGHVTRLAAEAIDRLRDELGFVCVERCRVPPLKETM